MRRSQGRRASIGSSKDNLVGVFLAKVAHRKNTGYARLAFFIGDDVAGSVHLYSGGNKLVVRGETDKNEHAFSSHFTVCAC